MTDRVVRLAARGDGVTADGRYVVGGVPGDDVAQGGALIRGEHYRAASCRHFGRCGGCQLQHVDDEVYTAFLSDRIKTALSEQGLHDVILERPHVSPPGARRRVTLRFERRGGDTVLGYNEGRSHTVFSVRECPVMRPALFAMIAPLRRLLGEVTAPRARGEIMLTAVDQGIDVLIQGATEDDYDRHAQLAEFAHTHTLARLSVDRGDGPIDVWAPEPPAITLSGTPVAVPHRPFLQATADGEAALIAAVTAHLGDSASVVDLFAGLGTFALALPATRLAVEGNRDAAAALRATGRVGVAHRDLFRQPLSAGELAAFDAVVLDPPRAGAAAQVGALAASAVPRIAYVSCNPATFARDAKALCAGGYHLASIKPVGQFRWSLHVELAAAFIRQAPPAAR